VNLASKLIESSVMWHEPNRLDAAIRIGSPDTMRRNVWTVVQASSRGIPAHAGVDLGDRQVLAQIGDNQLAARPRHSVNLVQCLRRFDDVNPSDGPFRPARAAGKTLVSRPRDGHAETVLLRSAIAHTVGLKVTDTKCIDLILRAPGATLSAG
jgi:hypothetical protein